MVRPQPQDAFAWLVEVRHALARAEAIAQGRGLRPDAPEHAWWLSIEEQLVACARQSRGIDEPLADPDATMDEITDITLALRRAAPGDPDDHHLNELQHGLLYYLAAHVHAHLCSFAQAAQSVHAAWCAAPPPEANTVAAPWEVAHPAPEATHDWLAEIRHASQAPPPPLITADGALWQPTPGNRGDAALAHALARRGVRASPRILGELARLLHESDDATSTDDVRFARAYLYAHILIGHADEAQARDLAAAWHAVCSPS